MSPATRAASRKHGAGTCERAHVLVSVLGYTLEEAGLMLDLPRRSVAAVALAGSEMRLVEAEAIAGESRDFLRGYKSSGLRQREVEGQSAEARMTRARGQFVLAVVRTVEALRGETV